MDYLEGEVRQLRNSVAKLQNGLKKADQEIQDQFESTVEVGSLSLVAPLIVLFS